MSCANPLHIKNNYYNPNKPGRPFSNRYWEVPCGYCLNCRVDKRNFLEDCCNYAYNEYGTGAFVTFTYDDNHIPLVTSPVDNITRQTLDKKDVQKFLYRIRSYIRYHHIDSKVCNPNFKFLYVGEYGDEFQRPHYHFIFFGLDWLSCKNMFYDCWKKGLIDSLPIKDGCFRYVLKYLDKQVKGKEKENMYIKHGVTPPFSHHSIKLGQGLFINQLDYIEENNYCYKSGIIDRPLSNYLKKKLLGVSVQNFSYIRDKAKSYNLKSENSSALGGYPLSQLNDFKHSLAKRREKNLYISSLDSGSPVAPLIPDTVDIVAVTEVINACVTSD